MAAYQLGHERREAERLRMFHPEEHAWALGSGAPLDGSVAISTRTGGRTGVPNGPLETLTCADRDVELVPDSPHLRHLVYLRGHQVQNRGEWRALSTIFSWPEAARPYIRTADCDARGQFRFPDVPSGAYILIAHIQSPDGEGSDTVVKPVVVRAGERLDLRFGDDWLNGPLQRR